MMILSTYNSDRPIPLANFDLTFPVKVYRNYEAENMLSTGDETAGTRDDWELGSYIYYKSYDSGTKKLILGNVPYVDRMIEEPTNWAVADMHYNNDISGNAHKISTINYIGELGAEKGVCEFILSDSPSYTGLPSTARFVVLSPKDEITMNPVPITTRGITGFTEVFFDATVLYKRPNGVWNTIIRGYRGSSYPARWVYRSYIANDPMGTWTAETGTNLFSDITDTFADLVYLNVFRGFLDKDGYVILPGVYKKSNNTLQTIYIRFDKYLTDVSYHTISFTGIDLSSISRWEGDNYIYSPSDDKYYALVRLTGAYDATLYLYSSTSMDGPFTLVETVISTDRNKLSPTVLKPTYISNFASTILIYIGGELRIYCGGEGSNKSGNYANHINSFLRKGATEWEWMPHPHITAYYWNGSSNIWGADLAWAKDHAGMMGFCIDGAYDGKLYCTFSYLASSDAYQSAVGYYNLNDILISPAQPVLTTPTSYYVTTGTKRIGLAQATPLRTEFSIVGGADASKVVTSTNYGNLRFIDTPDYSSPADANGDNIYEIVLRATSGEYYTDTPITITVVQTTTTTTTSTSSTTTSSTTITTTTVAPGGTTLATGLVAGYEFDETSGTTAIDVLGVNNGTHVNSPVVNQTGKINKCYTLATADVDYIDINQKLLSDYPFSISIWFKPSASAAVLFASNNVLNNYTGVQIGYGTGSPGNVTVHYGTGSGNGTSSRKSLQYNVNLTAGTWYHLVVTGTSNTSATTKVYINNSEIAYTSVSGTGTTTSWATGVVQIGRQWGMANTFSYGGDLDQTCIWSKELTTTEIAALYNSGNGLPYTSW